jgi:protease stability complex PrcB-like protein
MQSLIIATIVSLLFSGGASGCRTKNFNVPPRQSQSSTGQKDDTFENENQTSGNLKVIAQGFHSSITDPFVAVVRDDATYAELTKLDPNLPKLSIDLKTNVVIAAFLGERNTGGYSVEITRAANGEIQVTEKAPGKDVMVPQVITAPFKIVSMPVEGTVPVRISASDAFRQTAQLYRIDKGSFTISGGIAGRTETYSLAGKIQITRLGDLVTVGFAAVGSGTSRERSLRDVGTGVMTDNSFAIARMSRGSLVDPPTGDLRVTGKFSEANRLTLDLDTGGAIVPDGFSGRGSIEALMVAATAN